MKKLLPLGLLLCAIANGAISRITSTPKNDYSGAFFTAFPCDPFALASGNLAVVFITWYLPATRALTSITDTAGNTYSAAAAVQLRSGADLGGQVFYARNTIANATNVVTANFAGGGTQYISLIVRQYAGVATVSPLDAFVSNSGTATTLVSPAFTTSTANEVIFVACNPSGSMTAGTGYGNVTSDVGTQAAIEDQIVSTIQTGITATAVTGSNTSGEILLVATFKAAASAARTGSQSFIFEEARP